MKLPPLEPRRVFEIFEELCAIPHGSGNTAAIRRYCCDFAAKRGLWHNADELGNVVIKKPASPGFEDHSPVLLQGHLDMVCESEQSFDFEANGLDITVDGDYVTANGTTLGGDDGIAVAMILALFEDKTLPHPPLEALFTVDEETGMHGAAGFDPSTVTATRMINIDMEEEASLTVGCAGGAVVEIRLPLIREANDKPCWRIVVDGLRGGHSGSEIDKGLSNADRVMGRVLSGVGPLQLISFTGGNKDNAIPRRCEAIVAAARDPKLRLPFVEAAIRNQNEPDMTLTFEPVEPSPFCYDKMSTGVALSLLQATPNGVQSFLPDIPDQVQTSLNLGIARIEDDTLSLTFMVRSSDNDDKERLLSRLERVAREHGAAYTLHSQYPAWEYRSVSPLREQMIATYRDVFGREPVINTIHAGLECGILSSKIPGIDVVAMGPDLFDIHTTRERLSIPSTERVYRYLCRVLAQL